ncbi:MAG: ABC transporter permease [Bacteroidales bacterium]|nr:ABC transporter permease [Bacteroidales bacterium]
MNLHTTGVIIAREYLTRVKKKSFLIITFAAPVLFAAICILPTLIMFLAKDKAKSVAVVDQSGIVMPKLEDNKSYIFKDLSASNPDSLKASFLEREEDILLVISPVDTISRTVAATAYSEKPLSVDASEALSSRISSAVEDYRLNLYNIDGLKEIVEDLKVDVPLSTFTLKESGDEEQTSSEVYMLVSLLLSMVLYMFVTLFSASVMSGVIEEKSSRVVEVLISSVKSTELMFGKILGIAGVALTQFFLWIVLTIVIVAGVSAFVGFDNLFGSSDPAQMTEMMGGMDAMGMGGVDTADIMAASQEGGGEMGAVLSTLKNLNYMEILIAFIIYFILGYLLYASFFAAIGSAVENEADTQQLQIPVTIPMMIGFFISFYAFKAPDSGIVFWGSMIPFTSPIVMLARIPFGVKIWELVVSIVILLLTFIASAWASAKIYKVGILMFGKKSTFKDLWKWLKMK